MGQNQIDGYQINVPTFLQWGVAADRPSAAGTGYYYFETDTNDMFQDQGSWVQLNTGGGGGGNGSFQRNLTGTLTLLDGESLVIADYINAGIYDIVLEGDADLMIL